MKVLVTGGSGGLGRYVLRALEPVIAEIYHPSHDKFDVASLEHEQMEDVVGTFNTVVHLAALTDTGACEKDAARAVKVNTLATQNLVRACVATGTRLVLMSTDAVFSSGGPHSTTDTPAPDSVYGWSKLAAEQAVASLGYDGLIVRANFFTRHCNGKQSFANYVVSEAQVGRRITCYQNVRSTPVFAQTVAERIAEAVADEEHGTIHVASADAVNRVEQAAMICDAYGLAHDIMAEAEKRHDGRLFPSDLIVPHPTVRDEINRMMREEPL